jgi:23S rRNA (cytosine1962-C5)-methyltransferase
MTQGYREPTAHYQLLDTGEGYRLEQFGPYMLSRPDPQIIWNKTLSEKIWKSADAMFERTDSDKGVWNISNPRLPRSWTISMHDIQAVIKLSPFKHTGIFPEQYPQWEILRRTIQTYPTPPSVLNLFAYTGIASMIAAKAGAFVTHVDASKPAIGWAKENQRASNLPDDTIRWILDDCLEFARREVKRGKTYDIILMDPPAFGHGMNGKLWKFNEHFPQLLALTQSLLSDQARLVFVNAYAISSSHLMLHTMLSQKFSKRTGSVTSGELTLTPKKGPILSTGIYGMWLRK